MIITAQTVIIIFLIFFPYRFISVIQFRTRHIEIFSRVFITLTGFLFLGMIFIFKRHFLFAAINIISLFINRQGKFFVFFRTIWFLFAFLTHINRLYVLLFLIFKVIPSDNVVHHSI